jgi:hypothetical protein
MPLTPPLSPPRQNLFNILFSDFIEEKTEKIKRKTWLFC